MPADDANASGWSVPELSRARVRELAVGAGFTAAGVAALPHGDTEKNAARFEAFVEAGRAGTMEYLARRDEAGRLLRARVETPFPWARSVIVCVAGYNPDAPLSVERAEPDAGWIARYAVTAKRDPQTGEVRPSDYHKVLLKRLRKLEAELKLELGEFESKAFVDTGPVVERSLAEAAGLGWTGKNTCLIDEKLGSWNFLAVLVTSARVEDAELRVPARCGSCTRCLDACPTGALTGPREMDAGRCIAYLTIEHKGTIDESLRAGMGRQVFGCDICQDVCPWNRKAPIARDAELAVRPELVNPALEWLAWLDEAGFEAMANGSPMRRTGLERLRRNVAIAMGNSGERGFEGVLREWAGGSCGEMVAEAAGWALRELATKHKRS